MHCEVRWRGGARAAAAGRAGRALARAKTVIVVHRRAAGTVRSVVYGMYINYCARTVTSPVCRRSSSEGRRLI